VKGFGFKTDSAQEGGEGAASISDPVNLASYLFSNMKLVDEMAEEIREQLGDEADDLVEAQLKEGFRGIETEGVSFVVEKSTKFNLLIALFYDSDVFERKIAEKLCNKTIELFVYKYEKKLEKEIVSKKYDSFDSVLTKIYDDTISDMIKKLFLNLGSQNIIIPWLFLVHTGNVDLNVDSEEGGPQNDKRKHSLNSTHFSKIQGLSNIVNNQESDPEVEFAYNSDEDSVFSEYNNHGEKKHHSRKLYKKMIGKLEKDLHRQSKCIMSEVDSKEKTLKMLFKFNIDLEDSRHEEEKKSQNVSGISVEEEKDKKAQLKNDFVEFKKSKYFVKDPDKNEIMKELFKVAISANNIMKICGDKQEFNSIEMSLNKKNVLLDKSKVLIVKLNSLILVIPIKISRIEVKLRNTFFINEQPTLSALAMFIDFYLKTYSQ